MTGIVVSPEAAVVNNTPAMRNQIDITPYNHENRPALISLLQSESIPVEDFPL